MTGRTKRTEAFQASKRLLARATQRGVTTVEYAVMLVLVSLAVLSFGANLANSVKDTFGKVVVILGGSDGSGGGTGGGSTGGTSTNSGGTGNGNGNSGNGRGNGGGDGAGNSGGNNAGGSGRGRGN